jgi:serine/threonine protein kinase
MDLKYLNDCKYRTRKAFDRKKYIHPLVHEYLFYFALKQTGITPSVYRISLPTLDSGAAKQTYVYKSLKTVVERKFKFLNLPTPEVCEANGAETRFISYEDIGISAVSFFDYMRHRFMTERERLVMIFRLGVQAIRLVGALHANGISHGNVNGASIRFRESKNAWDDYSYFTDKVVLVDFHGAFLLGDDTPLADYEPQYAPPWHIGEKNTKSMRDDIYPVAELMALLISEGSLGQHIGHIKDKQQELKTFKERLSLIHHRGILGSIGLGSKRYKASDEFMKVIVEMNEDEVPPYQALESKLLNLIEIVESDGDGFLSSLFR